MKKIGIIGGLSCESSAEYYLKITRKANAYLGGYQTLPILMESLNPNAIIQALHQNNWQKAENILIDISKQLEKNGANCLVMPCNTLHKLIKEVQNHISIPIINIMDCVGNYIKQNSYRKVALLGTRFTMEDAFYRNYISSHFDVEVIVPNQSERNRLHYIIFNELCRGQINRASKKYMIDLLNKLNSQCQSAVLGCTELPLLIQQSDVSINLIDTVELHTTNVVNFAFN